MDLCGGLSWRFGQKDLQRQTVQLVVIERHAALCCLLVNDVDESDSSIVLVIFVPWDSDVQDTLY